jgi:hypothetical protein
MRAGRFVSWSHTFVEGLLSSSRRLWLVSFLFATLLGVLWGLANPPYSGPDEPAHVIRANAVAHGELTGSDRTPKRTTPRGTQDLLEVRAPSIYGSTNEACFAFQRDVPASCLVFKGSSHNTDLPTSAARHPPAYYAAVGVVSWLHRPGTGVVYLMRFVGALVMGGFVATSITALRRSNAPTLVAAGLLLALTPMVLFLSGVVNPSVPEIAASLAFWVAGLVLVTGSHERVDKRLITVLGISGCTLALSRQLGPLWIGLIAVAMFAMTSRQLLVNLARSNWARLWAGLIVASVLAQLTWDVLAKPLEVVSPGERRTHFDRAEVLRSVFGTTLDRVRQMIGTFGWLDTPAPALTWVPWLAAVGFFVFLAILWARRRDVVILVGLLIAIILVPALLESSQYDNVGGFFWQGRYTLPLAVGLPIFATIVLASTERGRQFANKRLLFVIGIVVCVAHVLAFAQNLRRYTVGYNGQIQFWKHAEWSPPVSSLLLTIGYTIVVIGFVGWMFAVAGSAPEHVEEVIRPRAEGALAPPDATASAKR